MIDPWIFILLSLAAFRIVRFLCDDSLIGFNVRSESEVGARLHRWGKDSDGNDRVWWRGRVVDGLGCVYCLGFWVSLILACAWMAAWPWQLGREGWLIAVALAGSQSLLNATDHRLNA